MTRRIAIAGLIGFTLLLAGRADAHRLTRGNSIVLLGIGGHTGEFVVGPFRLPSGEVGGELAWYRFMTDHWTLGLATGYHASRLTTDENNPNGTPLSTEKLDTHSFTVRVGGDRYAFIDDNVALYAGPGVVFGRGRAKDELTVKPPTVGGRSDTGPYATEVGLNGRIGMYARLRPGLALFGHIGQVLSRTTANGSGELDKISWWTSTHEGAVGLAFDF